MILDYTHLTDRQIIAIGDVHAEWQKFLNIITNYDLRECHLVQVGDWGAFLGNYDDQDFYKNLQVLLEERDIYLWIIRGNHDRPSLWHPDTVNPYNNIKHLSDGVLKFINFNLFCIGGAVSIDRDLNREGWDWWPDEVIRPLDNMEQYRGLKIDAVISHEAPIDFQPPLPDAQFLSNYTENTEKLRQDIIHDRQILQQLWKICRPEKWYYGHYHRNLVGQYHHTIYHCIGILELRTVYNPDYQ